ncbi:MAG TPA: ABC transporter ATP-binding protein [Blastocatellia bacterium]|nr:ABC transporter ATP-binding protein [Blastocatellia bacterium]
MIDLEFDRVSKKYLIQQELNGGGTRFPLRGRLRKLTGNYGDFWALKDVSFQVTRGETLGIIGPNGAGKSTILKLLSKITAPTSGEITINGRLSALIEVGSGFHPELTGRENIYLSGSILGMGRREIAKKLDSIIEFAGVHQFVDTPVKRYSSGMYVRLGFSIAAHLQPDILLLDEVLAVGDVYFQAKCYDRIMNLKDGGTTIVFISHDLNAVEFLCDRALLLDYGAVAGEGLPSDIISQYRLAANGAAAPGPLEDRSDGAPKPIQITRLTFHDCEEREVLQAVTGQPLIARVEFTASQPLRGLDFQIFYYSHDAKLHCQFSTSLGCEPTDIDRGEGTVQFWCAELGLQPGIYYADATIKRRADGKEIDWQYRSAILRVEPGKRVSGNFYAPHQWRITQPKEAAAGAILYERECEGQLTTDAIHICHEDSTRGKGTIGLE